MPPPPPPQFKAGISGKRGAGTQDARAEEFAQPPQKKQKRHQLVPSATGRDDHNKENLAGGGGSPSGFHANMIPCGATAATSETTARTVAWTRELHGHFVSAVYATTTGIGSGGQSLCHSSSSTTTTGTMAILSLPALPPSPSSSSCPPPLPSFSMSCCNCCCLDECVCCCHQTTLLPPRSYSSSVSSACIGVSSAASCPLPVSASVMTASSRSVGPNVLGCSSELFAAQGTAAYDCHHGDGAAAAVAESEFIGTVGSAPALCDIYD